MTLIREQTQEQGYCASSDPWYFARRDCINMLETGVLAWFGHGCSGNRIPECGHSWRTYQEQIRKNYKTNTIKITSGVFDVKTEYEKNTRAPGNTRGQEPGRLLFSSRFLLLYFLSYLSCVVCCCWIASRISSCIPSRIHVVFESYLNYF